MIGSITFKKGTSNELIKEFLSELEIEWFGEIPHYKDWSEMRQEHSIGSHEVWIEDKDGTYHIASINYRSHIGDQTLQEVKEKYEQHIQEADLSLHYLEDDVMLKINDTSQK